MENTSSIKDRYISLLSKIVIQGYSGDFSAPDQDLDHLQPALDHVSALNEQGFADFVELADAHHVTVRALAVIESMASKRNLTQLQEWCNSTLDAEEVASYGFDHVAVATGATWRRDGVARWRTHPIELDPSLPVLTPDDVMAGKRPEGEHVVIFDDDHYYMGGALAELLVSEGRRVSLVTPSARVSEWADHTMEQERIQGRLMELGVEPLTSKGLLRAEAGGVQLGCTYTGRESDLECDALLLVTSRLPNDELAQTLAGAGGSVRAVGDAYSPGTIAAAVWDGRRYAEELDAEPADPDETPFLRELAELSQDRVRDPIG